MSPEKIHQFLEERGEPGYRMSQAMIAFVDQGATSFDEVTTWSQELRTAAAAAMPAMSVSEKRVLVSSSGLAIKAALLLHDDTVIETVLMQPKPGLWTACISSQVGCAMACSFCATGKLGLMRNITAEEITDQVLFWIQYMKRNSMEGRVGNVVYMGMGEPFANMEHVETSLRILTDPKIFNIGDRHISVSTSGLVPGIIRFGKNWPQMNLALSLHSTNDAERSALMPVNNRFNLATVQRALQDYFKYANRKVFLEYILLKGKNDTPRHAQELVDFVHGIGKPHLLHVNLIVYNKTASDFEETPRDDARKFLEMLTKKGVHATIRKNLGRDIAGACGQLAGEKV